MDATFSLGRVRGIPVGLHWSVVVVAWLVTWSLASFRLSGIEPGLAEGIYWLVGGAGAVLFLGSLLAHELAHAVVAIRQGIGVSGITLWLFGGVARLDGEAPSARAELQVAAAGPMASFLMAGVFAATSAGLGALDPDPGPVVVLAADTLAWLGAMNLILAVFNLAPAAPLDGGRVLRAVLWYRSGDPVGATLTASRSGRAFGFLLTLLGLLGFLGGSTLSGLWLVFLGWFVLSAAGAEGDRAEHQRILGDLPVAAAMTPDPVVVPASITVQRLIDGYLFTHHCSSFPVIDPTGAVAGLVTLSLVKQVPPEQRCVLALSGVAQPIAEVVTSAPGDPLTDLVDRLSASPTRRALVFDHGALVGIVSPSDVVRILEARALTLETDRSALLVGGSH